MRVRLVLVASLVVILMSLRAGAQQTAAGAQQTAVPAQAPTPAALVARAEAIVDSFVARDFAKVFGQFSAGMKQALPQEKLPGSWDSILTQAGTFVKRGGTTTEVRGDYLVVIVSADFERNKANLMVTFDKAGEVVGFRAGPATPPVVYAPPDYANAASFTEEEITVGAPGWPLPGTLTMPVGAGPFAAIVLVHGSGPNDRDESFGPNKTFKDLALGLASRGIAVLRYDKRTKIHAAKLASVTSFTVQDETVDDALTAVALLRKTARIDPRRIYVLGHSLGGTLIPRIGAADPALAGLVVMAGGIRPLHRTILDQLQYLSDADGKISDAEQRAIDEAKKLADAVSKLTPADAKSATNLGGAPYSYWVDLRDYDPAKHAATLKQRLLILQGARDYQVTVDDFEKWKAALAGRPNVEFHLYPALNHLFLPGPGKSLPAEYMVPGHVPLEVITDIASWIK